jgi:WD40 repeat protein
VDIIDTESLEMITSMRLPPMHSVYAIDVDWHSEIVSVGTKGGLIYVFEGFSDKDFEERLPSRPLVQGTPVLSVSHIGRSRLAVSDIAGQCLLWHPGEEESPLRLDTRGEVVCSLLALSDKRLTGLSSEGTFLYWDLSKAELLHARHVCRPPPVGGLVRTVFWQAEQTIVCPGRKGNLVLYDPEKDRVREIKAHNGAFYAVSLLGEELLSIGMDDRCLKLWTPGSKKPFCKLLVQDDSLSVSHLGGLKRRILVIGIKGLAQVYELEKDSLVFEHRMPGEDYRVSISPPPQMIEAYNEMRKEQEVYEVWAKLDNLGPEDQEATGMYLSRLGELGYEHVMMAIQADRMEREGDTTQCLRRRAALVGILPEHQAACPSFERYAASLYNAWLLSEAENTCKKILEIDPNYSFSLDLDRISRVSELMKTNRWTIEPDIPLETVVEAFNAVGHSFLGRYLIKKLPSFHCKQTILGSESITEKYEEIRRESRQEHLPEAGSEKGWWISRTEAYEIELVTFGKTPLNDMEGLCFALQVWPHAQGTVVVPVILFKWQNHDAVGTVEELNKKASKALACLTNSASSSYVREIHRAANHALRQLITKSSWLLRSE